LLIETMTHEFEISTEYQGVKDFQGAFASGEEARRTGDHLKQFINDPDLMMLPVKSDYNNAVIPSYHEDLRSRKKEEHFVCHCHSLQIMPLIGACAVEVEQQPILHRRQAICLQDEDQ